ncbi:MAG: hypothetical protein C5B55_09285 [Blastocatellia bacterium]|nr:MAG: hypothetical protein C5B55_09285 [Blastocatellia bacterium]
MTDNQPRTSFDIRFVWAVCAAIFIIYVLFPTKNYYYDGITFAQTIEDATSLNTSLIHPNHLIYELVGYFFYHLLRLINTNIRAVTALQILNSILAACAVYFFIRISLRSFGRLYIGLCLGLFLAFSSTWWKFATDADAYIPSVLFLLISFYLILPGRELRPFLVAVMFSIAMCFHELAIMFGPVAVLGLYFQTQERTRGEQLSVLCRFALLGLALTLGAYFLGFHKATGSFDLLRFARWLTSFSPDADVSFNLAQAAKYTARGNIRLLFGGRLTLLKGLMNPFVWFVVFLLALTVIGLIVQLVRTRGTLTAARIRALRANAAQWQLFLLCVTWAISFLVFLFFWLPQNTFYRLFYLPALLLLVGLVVKALGGEPHYRLALFTATLSLSNFLFLTLPYSYEVSFPPLAFSREMSKVWPAGAIVYYGTVNSDESLFRYFNPHTTWKLMKADQLDAVERDMASNPDVWMDATGIEQLTATPKGAEWLAQHHEEEHELKNPLFNLRFVHLRP